MKKSLLTGALAAIMIASASLFAPTDCLAAPPKQPPRQSVKAPRPSRPPAIHRAEHKRPPTVNRASENRRPPAMQRQETRKPPAFNRAGENRRPPAVQRQEMRKPPAFNRAGENRRPPAVKPQPSGRPNIGKQPSNVNRPPRDIGGKHNINNRPNSKPPTSGFDKHPNNKPPHNIGNRPNGKPPTSGFDKHPNNKPPQNIGNRPNGKPPTSGFDKHPNNRPPHDIGKHHPPAPPKHRPHHHRHYFYSGLYLPAIYGGYYYGVHYDNPTVIMRGITVCPADHPNIFLLNLMLTKNLYSENDFAVFYSGQTALDYDATHGTGAFYRLAIENAPDIKKWKSSDTAPQTQPTITSLDDYLTKYHFVPSTDTLFDGKHLYKFDPDTSAFVENQTIEGLTTTYKHGKFYLICASPQGELPKYYLVLKDAIYETAYTAEADCPDHREINQDTKRLWKLLK